MFYYLIGILGAAALCVGLILFFIGRKKEKLVVEQALEQYKEQLKRLTADKRAEFDELSKQVEGVQREYANFIWKREFEHERALEAEEHANQLLATELENIKARLADAQELEEQRIKHEMEKKEQQYAAQLEFKKQQFAEDFEVLNNYYQSEIAVAKYDLDDFQARRAAVNEAIRREKEIEEKEDFYSIEVPQADQEDIRVLQDMDLKMHNRDVIPKLIWELFIRRPLQEMIKRVTGGRKMGGIYKITYKKTGEAYVGKTTDFATRWTNHCKTAIGLEGAARATLHNRLRKDGLWNYTWEILEEVNKDNLASREAFYIDLYGTKQQLNMKEGSK